MLSCRRCMSVSTAIEADTRATTTIFTLLLRGAGEVLLVMTTGSRIVTLASWRRAGRQPQASPIQLPLCIISITHAPDIPLGLVLPLEGFSSHDDSLAIALRHCRLPPDRRTGSIVYVYCEGRALGLHSVASGMLLNLVAIKRASVWIIDSEESFWKCSASETALRIFYYITFVAHYPALRALDTLEAFSNSIDHSSDLDGTLQH